MTQITHLQLYGVGYMGKMLPPVYWLPFLLYAPPRRQESTSCGALAGMVNVSKYKCTKI